MDKPRLTSPPSIRVSDFNSNCDNRRSSPESSSRTSISAQPPSCGAMPIRSTTENPVPPPLPPPRYIEVLAHGIDPGWNWGNPGADGGFGKSTLPSIKETSSLHIGYSRPEPLQRSESFTFDDASKRRGVIPMPTSKSATEARSKGGFSHLSDERFPNSSVSTGPSPLSVSLFFFFGLFFVSVAPNHLI